MAELLEQFLLWCTNQHGWSAYTIMGHRTHLLALCAWYRRQSGEDLSMQSFTVEVCRAYVVHRVAQDVRPRTVHADICTMRAFGRWAVGAGHLSANPATPLRGPKLDEPSQKSCTEAEKESLMDAALHRLGSPVESALASAVLATFLYSGLRRAELQALDTTDIVWGSLSRQSVVVVRKGKGRKRREVPINSALARHLKHWLTLRQAAPEERALWVSKGRRLSGYMVYRMIEDVKVAAALGDHDNLTPHGFRHYFATELARAGVPIKEIQELLGHSNIQTTMLYLQCHRENLFDAVERLARPAPTVTPPKTHARQITQSERRKASFRR